MEVTQSSMADETHNQLFQAAFTGNLLLLESLLRDDPLLLDRASDETPVHVAALRGHAEFVASALDHSPRLAGNTDSRGLTPLHVAAGAGSNDVVKEILRRMSADGVVSACLARAKDGRIPLHVAVEKARVEVVAELARAWPSSTRERTARGETVMQLCVRCDCLEGMKLIAEMDGGDALLGETDDDGNTLLHLAVLYKQLETVKYLVAKAGNKEYLNAQNKNGLTPFDLIYNSPRDMESLQILTFLLESGFKRSESRSESNPPTTNHHPNPPNKRLNKFFRYTPAYTSELDSLRGPLIITAAVLAVPAFQLGVNPPQDGSDMTTIWGFTSISLSCSLAAIVLLVSGFPLRRSEACAWVVVSLFLACIVCLMIAYWGSILSNESRYSSGIDVTVFVCLGFFVVVAGVGLVHLVRLVAWVWMKVIKCGRRRRAAAASQRGDKDVSAIA